MRGIAVFAAACAFAGAAWAQTTTTTAATAAHPPPRGLVFHVAATRGAAPTVSLGIVQQSSSGVALQGRREMQADCTWSEAGDLQVDPDSVVPLRDPAGLGGAEQFGDYYATLFNALATAGGAAPTPAQFACVRRTMATLGASLMRRGGQAQAQPPAAPER
jgi:hypothetical protein